MIHFLTVHWRSERWIEPQLAAIERETRAEYRIWACLNGIDAKYKDRFYRTFELEGDHGEKLNELARLAGESCADDDLLVFIDGDAYPIASWVEPVTAWLESVPVVAVQRLENLGDPQPHPCFAVMTAAFWKKMPGDWTRTGKPWTNSIGNLRRDAGGHVLDYLESNGLSWHPLVRSNTRNPHPVLFAIYGDLVYHHGAAFRETSTMLDRYLAGCHRWKRGPMGWIAKRRLARRVKRNLVMSEEIFAGIERDPLSVKRVLLTSGAETRP